MPMCHCTHKRVRVPSFYSAAQEYPSVDISPSQERREIVSEKEKIRYLRGCHLLGYLCKHSLVDCPMGTMTSLGKRRVLGDADLLVGLNMEKETKNAIR